MSQQLIISKKVQPPPTKTEVINAILTLSKEDWKKRQDDASKALVKVKNKIHATAFRLSKKMAIEDADFTVYSWSQGHDVKVSFAIPTDSMLIDIAEHKKLSLILNQGFDEKKERKAIQYAINGVKAGRVEAMLGDEDTRKKLTSLATELGVL